MPKKCNICKEKRASFNKPNEKIALYCGDCKEEGMINVTSKKCKKCDKRPYFNFPGEKNGIYCSDHKDEEMIDISEYKLCKICKKVRASFGYEGKQAEFCVKDKKEGMVNLMIGKCKYNGCKIAPSFNYPDKKGYLYCAQHKLDGMICTRGKKCKCGKSQPNYNFEGSPAEYCGKCKKPNMVNVRSPRCQKCKLPKQRIYNLPGLKPLYCGDCATDDMINVRKKKICEEPDCKRNPSFNYPGIQKYRFCLQHKKDDMINVRENYCQYPGCKHQSYFNFPGIKKGIYCSMHAQDGMVYVKNRICLEENCKTMPVFNYPNEVRGIYCKIHAKPNMINVVVKKCIICKEMQAKFNINTLVPEYCENCSPSGSINVNRKICLNDRCKISANYGPLFGANIHCVEHKNSNEYIKNNPTCELCDKKPHYTDDKSNYPKRCEDHKKENDVNVIEKPCISCKLPFYLNESTGLCNDCNDFVNEKLIKIKETKIKNLLDANDTKYTHYDKSIDLKCSRYRPDFVIDLGSFFVILEVDENQHKSYARECEISRMIQVHQDCGMKCIFIRYNPDNYRDHQNELIQPQKSREKILLDLIKGLKNRDELDEGLSAYFLFYDGYNGISQKIEIDYFNKSILELSKEIYNC